MSLTVSSRVYKPFRYPWAYKFWQEQQRMHWLAAEVPMGPDVKDWQTKLTPAEVNLLSNIFRFFTQGDIEVNECYMTKYAQIFKPVEVKMMLSAISNTETIHIDAYSHLLETLGIPETEYRAFLEYETMMNKVDMLEACSIKDPWDVAETMGVYAAFTEGLQLFASFAILLNFPRYNKMRGMGQIVTWSVRDESLHVEAIMKLYHTYVSEHPEIDTDRDWETVGDLQ